MILDQTGAGAGSEADSAASARVSAPTIVRRLQPPDLSAVCAYGARAHERSSYAAHRYNAVIFRRALQDALRDPANAPVWVAMSGGACYGILAGAVFPASWFAGMVATDVVFNAERKGDALLREFLRWCRARKIARVDMAVGEQHDPRVDAMYVRAGFARGGHAYHINLRST